MLVIQDLVSSKKHPEYVLWSFIKEHQIINSQLLNTVDFNANIILREQLFT